MNMSETQTEKIDWSKVTEMEKALGEYTAEKLARVQVFDPKAIVRKAKEVREVFDKDLKTIRYVLLSYNDLNDIVEKYKDNKDRSVHLLLHQLQPTNPALTEQDIRNMPYEVVVRLLTVLQTDGSFFHQKPAPSKNGSASTEEHKISA